MNNDEPDSPPCDDDLFNDPAFLAKIDQAANDHLSQRQQQSQQQHDERPAKRLKADNHLLQQQIDQVRNALQQAEKDKRTLSGQIAIIKSHLKLAKENNNQQLNQLQKQQQEYKSRAEEAEQRLAKLENQRALKDTFKGFEQSVKKNTTNTPRNHTQQTQKNAVNNKDPKLQNLQHSLTPQQQPQPSFNQFHQSTLPPQPSPAPSALPKPRPSISFIEPSSPLDFPLAPPTQSPPTSPGASATHNSLHLIHSVGLLPTIPIFFFAMSAY